MAPVRDCYVFKDDERRYGPLATNLWTKYMQVYTLTEIMRQREQTKFCELLNRLRTGDSTQEDHEIFESRIVRTTDNQYLSQARHFFPLKITTINHNEIMFVNSENEKMSIYAYDFVTGNPSEKMKQKCKLYVKTSNKYAEKNGLLRTLNAAVGSVYTTSVNIKTDDGLINGATCILKKIHFLQRNHNNIPSILWVGFDDETIGQQWRQRYSNLYTEDVHQSWTPIFAVDRQFPVTNARIMRTQFPLKPAAATTIHSGQGCTFHQICISMDLSDSKGLSQNKNLARLFLQHAHYVAASRVTSLQGLQILSWNKDLISINNDVKKHMEYLYKNRKVQLSYTPVYMMDGLKCSFLNTRSLHKHFRSVQRDHNICASDIFFLSETRLISSDRNDSYHIQNFQIICRNDQEWNKESRPPHGIICYVKDTIKVLEVQKRSCQLFEAIFVCVQHTSLPIPVQLIGIYVSPKSTFNQVIHELHDLIIDTDDTCDTIIIGDFNMKSICSVNNQYNTKLEQHMKKCFNFNQVIHKDTSNYTSILDLCFTRSNVKTSIIWNYWSDHRILSVAL